MSAPYRIASVKERALSFDTYRYLRVPESGLHQIAFKFHVDQEKEELRFSFAICSPNDNFSFKTAREKLQARFIDKPAISPTASKTQQMLLDNPFYIVDDYDRDASLIQNAVWAIEGAIWNLEGMKIEKRSKKKFAAKQHALDTYRLFLDTAAAISARDEMQFQYLDNTSMMATLRTLFGFRKPPLVVHPR